MRLAIAAIQVVLLGAILTASALNVRRQLRALTRHLSEALVGIEVTVELRLASLLALVRDLRADLAGAGSRGGLRLAHPSARRPAKGRACAWTGAPAPRERVRRPCARGPRSLRR